MREFLLPTNERFALKKELLSQERANQELFQQLGISSEELEEFLNDKSRFPDEVWQALEQTRTHIRTVLEQK